MSYDNPRIKDLNMRPMDIVMVMAEGNPGAIRVMMELYESEPTIDPDSMWRGLGCWFGLDTLDIYGSRIWMLYKDVCGQDIEKVHAVLRGHQLGYVSESLIHAAINGQNTIDTDQVLKTVKERLPAFGKKPLTTT